MPMDILTFNVKTTRARTEMLEDQEHWVIPGAMLAEGVWVGNRGPILYEGKDISDSTPDWDHMPIVVQHPKGKDESARKAPVINASKVGIILHTKYDTKLRPEFWINKKRADKVEPKIRQAIEAGNIMEVSTGLRMSLKKTTGVHNQKKYESVCVALRAFMEANGRRWGGYIVDLFPDYVIYTDGNDYYKMSYNASEDGVEFKGEPTEVDRKVTYVAAKNAAETEREKPMDKKTLVDRLITNGAFEEADRAWLMEQKPEKLEKLAKGNEQVVAANQAPQQLVLNAAPEKAKESEKTPLTWDELKKLMPAELVANMDEAMVVRNEERERLIKQIVEAGKKKGLTINESILKEKPLPDLRLMATFAGDASVTNEEGKTKKPAPLYTGAGAGTDQTQTQNKEARTPLGRPNTTEYLKKQRAAAAK
jgi:hypothetical protein